MNRFPRTVLKSVHQGGLLPRFSISARATPNAAEKMRSETAVGSAWCDRLRSRAQRRTNHDGPVAGRAQIGRSGLMVAIAAKRGIGPTATRLLCIPVQVTAGSPSRAFQPVLPFASGGFCRRGLL